MPDLSVLSAQRTNTRVRDETPRQLAALVSELERRGAELSLASAAELLARAALSAEDVRPFVATSERGYVRRRVARSEAFELLVMTWSKDQGSGPHDHGDSHCALRVLSGSITEAHFARRSDGLVEVRDATTHQEGQVVTSARDGIHALSAPHDAASPTVTLHVYVPPLPEMRRYAAGRAGEAPFGPFARTRGRGRTVAVIGGGFSGTMVAAHVLRSASARNEALHVVLFERQTAFGEGTAYRTADFAHLLNVPAARMSAWPDRPDHFVKWARASDPSVEPCDFLPRRRYGEYLRNTLFEAAQACAGPVSLEIKHDEVQRVVAREGGYRVSTASGLELAADGVVLASGHRPPRDPFGTRWLGSRARLVAEPWGSLAITAIAPDEPVLVVGSGLSAVDVVLTLNREPRRAPISMVSHHGRLPAAHTDRPVEPRDAQSWLRSLVASPGGPSARQLLARVREEVRSAERSGSGWRAVIDGLRPHTESLWSSLSEREARRFLRHLRPLWEVHRHRMAPQVAAQMDALAARGLLDVRAGRVRGARADGSGVTLDLLRRGAGPESLRVAWVVNCTGPSPGVEGDPDPVVACLLEGGHLTPDPLGLGVLTGARGEALGRDGRLRPNLVVIGPLRAAQLWESSAVPELRLQARDAAAALLRDDHDVRQLSGGS